MNPVSVEKIRQLAAQGMSQATIGTIVGRSRERIRQICNREGIETLDGSIDYDRRDKVGLLAAGGVPVVEIAKLTASTPRTIRQDLKSLGLAETKAPTKTARLMELAEAGFTQAEAARELGWTAQNVWTTARRVGITFSARAKRAPINGRKIWTDSERVALLARVKSGALITDIAREYGLSPQAIGNQLVKARSAA